MAASNDIRDSLNSITSLLEKSGKSPMMRTSTASSPPSSSLYPRNNPHSSNYGNTNMNDNSNDYMTLHSPSLSLLSPQTPATQATVPSDQRLFLQQQQLEEEERYQANNGYNNSNNINNINSAATSRSGGQHSTNNSSHLYYPDSDRSSSICNFSKSSPYQIKTATSSSLGFATTAASSSGKDHGGTVIGSPLSAFSAVHGTTVAVGSAGKKLSSGLGWNESKSSQQQQQRQHQRSSLQHYSEDGSRNGASVLDDHSSRNGGGTRETMSLLVSPPTARMEHNDTTNTDSNDPTTMTNINPNAKDPTPYHYRGNPPARDYSVQPSSITGSSSQYHSSGQYQQSGRAQQQQQQKQREEQHHRYSHNTSSSSSRSVDPPAKSPFGSAVPAGGGGQQHYRSHHHHLHSHHHQQPPQQLYQGQASTPNPNHPSNSSHPITELSIIEEDDYNNHFDNRLNQSQTSTVTGFTLPRTPVVLRDDANLKTHSGGRGITSTNNNTHAHGGGSVAFTTHTPTNSSRHQNPTTLQTPYSQTSTTNQEKLLHHPTQTLRTTFQQLASQTHHQLEQTWDIVGIVPEERATQLADLIDRIAALCQEKIDQEEQLADQFRKEIREARREWEEGCKVLKIDDEEGEDPLVKIRRDPSVSDNIGGSGVGVSLQSEYEVMMGRLESVRERREVARVEIGGLQERIFEAYAALNGCDVEEVRDNNGGGGGEMEAWRDVESDLTEDRREEFRAKAVEYEESVSSRTQAVVSLLVDCQNLIRELEIVPPGCECRDDDDNEGYVHVGQNGDDVKIMNSLKSIERSNDDDGRPRKSSDSYTVTSLFESSSCIGIGKDALDRLTSRIAELNGEKRRRRNKLGEMGAAIASLWGMLRVSSEEQRAFTKSIRGLGMDTLEKGEQELSRLHELKAVMIGKLIREQRQEIEELWERTNASVGEKASFDKYFYVDDEDKLTDELLAKHEEYVGALNAKLEKMQPILDLIQRREIIIEERVELEVLQRDPDRLKGRNATKQLMKEEKMTRRVKKELPKITQHLEKKLKEWYVANKPSQTDEDDARDEDLGHFMYKGLPYLKTMKDQEHEWMTRKEKGEKERQRKRQEERATSSGSAFGSTYSKLPGKKWNPSSDRPRSASNMRPGSRGLRPGDVNRVNRPGGERANKPGMTNKSSGYGARAASAPRMRL